MDEAQLEIAQEKILKFLENSSKPLSKSALTKSGGKLGLEALLVLEKSKKIKNRGTLRRSAYVVLSENRTLGLTQMAESLILGSQPGKMVPVLLSKIKESTKDVEIRDLIETGARNLFQKKRGIMFECGSGLYFLHLDPIRDFLNSPAEEISSEPKNTQSSDSIETILRSKYREVVDKTRSPDISIAALIRASNLPPNVVKDWLIGECTAHKANPSKGEPTLASAEEKSAALDLDGELFYLIRLLK